MTILQKRIEASLTYNGQKIYFISLKFNILNFTNVLMQRVNSILIRGEVYSIHPCLITIQICRDLLPVDGILRVFWFPPPIKLGTATI
jgi:hypothetical protein